MIFPRPKGRYKAAYRKFPTRYLVYAIGMNFVNLFTKKAYEKIVKKISDAGRRARFTISPPHAIISGEEKRP